MSARDDILARIRSALTHGADAEIPELERNYVTRGSLPNEELIDLFVDRLIDYRALVRRCPVGDLASTVSTALAERGTQRIVVPVGLEVAMPAHLTVIVDDGQLSAAALDACDGVVTRVAVAIAETGTVVLDGSRGQGRRAITLVPDYHLCIVRADQVLETVPEAVAQLTPYRPMTWISGPSATSDIELSRVEGVHGPRTLEIIVVS